MQVEILYRPSSSVANVTLEAGEGIQVESGAMLALSPTLVMETEAEGGLAESLSRALFGGESFFLNTYTAGKSGERIFLAAPLPGDISVVELHNSAMLVQSGAYLASSTGLQVDTRWAGAKSFFAGEGFVMLEVSGTGTLIIASYGAIHPLTLDHGEQIMVDTGHLVAFDRDIKYEVKKVAGWKSTLFSGEGLVVELTGPGQLYLQGRSQDSFLSWLLASLPEMFLQIVNRNG